MVAHPLEDRHAVALAAFLALPDDGNRHEFVRGEVRTWQMPKGSHGRFEVRILKDSERHLDDRAVALGWDAGSDPELRDRLVGFTAGGAFGMQFSLPDDEQQIRGADGVYVPAEQFARTGWDGIEYFPEVPYLVIEVISASETAADIAEKVQDYLQGAARRVWCLYPTRAMAHVHDVAGPTRVLRHDDTLTDPELLPGFALPLRQIFSAPEATARKRRADLEGP